MTARLYCDRCRDEIFMTQSLQIRDEYGSQIWNLCERCSVALRIWVENRPYSPLPASDEHRYAPLAENVRAQVADAPEDAREERGDDYDAPELNLGRATTRELLTELVARAEVGGYAGYRTVDFL